VYEYASDRAGGERKPRADKGRDLSLAALELDGSRIELDGLNNGEDIF
jgi:hypothetical protein